MCKVWQKMFSSIAVAFFQGRDESAPETFTMKMKRKIDSIKGRLIAI